LHDADGVVDANPRRPKAARVIGVCVLDIARLADEILPTGEFENVEVLHVNCTPTPCWDRSNPFFSFTRATGRKLLV
jgi:hypothetical protein